MLVRNSVTLPGYERLAGVVPIVHAPQMEQSAAEVRSVLEAGVGALSGVLVVGPPELEAILISNEDWEQAPRENTYAYPLGLPYFTRSVYPPALVLPTALPPTFQPQTEATYPLVVWHELAHAFLLQKEVVRTPAWLREFVSQASAAAVARRVGLPLAEHLSQMHRDPGFTIRALRGHVDAEEQMAFQNLLLSFGVAALEEFGEGFLEKLVHAVWEETDIVDEERAEELLATALGPGGRTWLRSRPEF
jgi:hypothetical protein